MAVPVPLESALSPECAPLRSLQLYLPRVLFLGSLLSFFATLALFKNTSFIIPAASTRIYFIGFAQVWGSGDRRGGGGG